MHLRHEFVKTVIHYMELENAQGRVTIDDFLLYKFPGTFEDLLKFCDCTNYLHRVDTELSCKNPVSVHTKKTHI